MVCVFNVLRVVLPQLSNHDMQRISDRFGPAGVDAMNILLLTLPGIAITYNVSMNNTVSTTTNT